MNKYFQVPWSIKEILLLTSIPTIILGFISFLLGSLEIDDTISQLNRQGLITTGLFALQSIIILMPLWLWGRHKYQLKLNDYGFTKIGLGKSTKEILLHYLLYLGITAIVATIIFFTQLKIPGYQAQQSILPHFGEDGLSLIIAALVIVIIAPLVEEIFFRGFLLRSCVKKFDYFLGSTLSAAIFAVFHLQLQNIIPIFILGLIINSLVIRNKSIWPAIGFHIINNAVAFAIQVAILKGNLPTDALFS